MATLLRPSARLAPWPLCCLALFVAAVFTAVPGAEGPDTELPREWIDGDTGHRIVRLSDEPGSQSPYFHQDG